MKQKQKILLRASFVFGGFFLFGCTREATVSVKTQNVACTSEVEVGMEMKDVVAAKGKPLAVVSSGDRLIGRWSDAVVRFEREMVTRIERRNHAREEAVRLRCEKAAAELAVRKVAAAKQAEVLRRQAERDNEAYVQNLEAEKQREVRFAMQEDARMRQSSFGTMPSVRISCPSEIQDRIGLSTETASFPSAGLRAPVRR